MIRVEDHIFINTLIYSWSYGESHSTRSPIIGAKKREQLTRGRKEKDREKREGKEEKERDLNWGGKYWRGDWNHGNCTSVLRQTREGTEGKGWRGRVDITTFYQDHCTEAPPLGYILPYGIPPSPQGVTKEGSCPGLMPIILGSWLCLINFNTVGPTISK